MSPLQTAQPVPPRTPSETPTTPTGPSIWIGMSYISVCVMSFLSFSAPSPSSAASLVCFYPHHHLLFLHIFPPNVSQPQVSLCLFAIPSKKCVSLHPQSSVVTSQAAFSWPNIEIPRSTSMTLSFCGVVTITAAVILTSLVPRQVGDQWATEGSPWHRFWRGNMRMAFLKRTCWVSGPLTKPVPNGFLYGLGHGLLDGEFQK